MGIVLSNDGLTDSQRLRARRLGLSDGEMLQKLKELQPNYKYDTTIIIPVYNGEKFIKECIESALNQTAKNVEVVVVDDGSTDGTLKILYEMEGITVLIKPNGGTASALNTGIRQARGNWIHWLSADDVLYPDAIEKMMETISTTPNMQNYIFYSNYDIIDADGKIIGDFIEPIGRNFRRKEERYVELLGNYYGNGSTTMIHKSVFEKVKYDESLAHSEDYKFMLEAMSKGFDMKLVPIKTLKYRRHKDQLTNKVGGSLSDFIRKQFL